jgi:hypothetical protein
MLLLPSVIMNRLETVGETLRATINTLAVVDSLWMSKHAGSDWFTRYARRFEQSRLPRTKEGSISAAEQLGADGMKLLEAIWDCGSPLYLRSIPMVENLAQMLASRILDRSWSSPHASSGESPAIASANRCTIRYRGALWKEKTYRMDWLQSPLHRNMLTWVS